MNMFESTFIKTRDNIMKHLLSEGSNDCGQTKFFIENLIISRDAFKEASRITKDKGFNAMVAGTDKLISYLETNKLYNVDDKFVASLKKLQKLGWSLDSKYNTLCLNGDYNISDYLHSYEWHESMKRRMPFSALGTTYQGGA